jgi:hypothetical protein
MYKLEWQESDTGLVRLSTIESTDAWPTSLAVLKLTSEPLACLVREKERDLDTGKGLLDLEPPEDQTKERDESIALDAAW